MSNIRRPQQTPSDELLNLLTNFLYGIGICKIQMLQDQMVDRPNLGGGCGCIACPDGGHLQGAARNAARLTSLPLVQVLILPIWLLLSLQATVWQRHGCNCWVMRAMAAVVSASITGDVFNGSHLSSTSAGDGLARCAGQFLCQLINIPTGMFINLNHAGERSSMAATDDPTHCNMLAESIT